MAEVWRFWLSVWALLIVADQGGAGLVGAGGYGGGTVWAVERPNVIIFLVDDMGVMDTSVPFLTDDQGRPQRYPLNDFYRTPNMELLASRGVRFNNFCAMSVCSPTRNSIMTGQNAARHRTTNWIDPNSNNRGPNGPKDWNWKGLNASHVTLPRILQASGYRTIHVGKGHFAPRSEMGENPTHLGFDLNVAGCSIGAPATYFGQQGYGATGKRKANAVPGLEKYHGTETFLTDALTLEAKAAITAAVRAKQPFFLNLAHYAVHAPFDSDPRFAEHYRASGRSPAAQAFATLIEGMDQSLGDLLTHLDELGIAENTLILFLGDNGSDAPLGHEHAVACAAPLRGRKGSHYEGGMRVPMIAAWARPNPGHSLQATLPIKPGAIQTQLATVCDLFPTILAATNNKVPAGHAIDGRPLHSLLSGRPDPNRPQRFLMHYPHSPHRSNYFTSFRNEEWKVIYHYFPSQASENSHYQLYHLATDPFESTNLAELRRDVLRRMMVELIAELQACAAVYPQNEKGEPVEPQLPPPVQPSP